MMGRPRLDRKCETPGCDRPHQARGWCAVHYQSPRPCDIEGCDRPHRARGRCGRHYRSPNRCTTEACWRPVHARGRCGRHYRSPSQKQPCTWRGCAATATWARSLCNAHYLRQQRGKRMDGPIRRRWTPDEDRVVFTELARRPPYYRDWHPIARYLDRTRSSVTQRGCLLSRR